MLDFQNENNQTEVFTKHKFIYLDNISGSGRKGTVPPKIL